MLLLFQTNIIVILGILLSVTILLLSQQTKTRKRRLHERKVKTAWNILRKLNDLQQDNQQARILSYLKKIDPYVFEELILCAFEKKGYTIKRGERYSGDGGVDGKIYKNHQLYLIQAKRYKNYIKKQHVIDFIDIVQKNNAFGFFIHTGKTSSEIFKLVKDSNISIISGHRLIDLIYDRSR